MDESVRLARSQAVRRRRRARVAGDVLLVLALELLHEVVHQALIEVLTAEVRVTRGGLHLEDALLDREERHVERPAAQVEDEDVAFGAAALRLLIEAVRDSRGGGLVDDAHAVDAGDDRGILGGLALRVVEVRGHGDDGVLHLLAEVRLRHFLHLHQDHGRDLLGGELLLLAVELDGDHGLLRVAGLDLERPVLDVRLDLRVGVLAPDEALRVEHGVDRVHRGLVLRGVADEALGIGKRDVRRRRARAHVVGDDLDAAVDESEKRRVSRSVSREKESSVAERRRASRECTSRKKNQPPVASHATHESRLRFLETGMPVSRTSNATSTVEFPKASRLFHRSSRRGADFFPRSSAVVASAEAPRRRRRRRIPRAERGDASEDIARDGFGRVTGARRFECVDRGAFATRSRGGGMAPFSSVAIREKAGFARGTYRSCCQTPTQEYVVPRSIPIAGPSTLAMMLLLVR